MFQSLNFLPKQIQNHLNFNTYSKIHYLMVLNIIQKNNIHDMEDTNLCKNYKLL